MLEVAIAVPMHYAVGITRAPLYLLLISALRLSPRNLIVALAFGLFTNIPWLLMFPTMGYGLFGTHGPPGNAVVSH